MFYLSCDLLDWCLSLFRLITPFRRLSLSWWGGYLCFLLVSSLFILFLFCCFCWSCLLKMFLWFVNIHVLWVSSYDVTDVICLCLWWWWWMFFSCLCSCDWLVLVVNDFLLILSWYSWLVFTCCGKRLKGCLVEWWIQWGSNHNI